MSELPLYLKKIQLGSKGAEYLFEVVCARSVLSFVRPERGRNAYHMHTVCNVCFRLFPERFDVVIKAESISKHPCPSHFRLSHAISGRLFSEGLYRDGHSPRSLQIWTLTKCVNCIHFFCCCGYCRRSLLSKTDPRLRSISLSCDLQP